MIICEQSRAWHVVKAGASRILKFREITLLFFLCTWLTACSQTPVPVSHSVSLQKRMQAAAHWDMLAEDVAERVANTLQQKKVLYGLRLYVEQKNASPFDQAFYDLLLPHLVQKPGINIVTKESALCNLSFDAQVIRYEGNRVINPPWKLTALGAGIFAARQVSGWSPEHIFATLPAAGLVGDVFFSTGMYGLDLNSEVIITTSLWHKDELVHATSDIYYIQGADRQQYEQDMSWYKLVADES